MRKGWSSRKFKLDKNDKNWLHVFWAWLRTKSASFSHEKLAQFLQGLPCWPFWLQLLGASWCFLSLDCYSSLFANSQLHSDLFFHPLPNQVICTSRNQITPAGNLPSYLRCRKKYMHPFSQTFQVVLLKMPSVDLKWGVKHPPPQFSLIVCMKLTEELQFLVKKKKKNIENLPHSPFLKLF